MPGDLVGVSLVKGAHQVASVLGVLAAGAAYLPIGVDQPLQRCQRIVQQAGVMLIIAEHDPLLPEVRYLKPARALEAEPLPAPLPVAPDALAYVIYTSGSTGQPKGVEITHRAAMNTVADINRRYGVQATDRGLALSALDFDLSVYDLFGLLSVGAALVLIDEHQRRDARAWLKALQHHGVTLWNSVPALLDMLLEANVHDRRPLALRVALLSGDWIGLDLPARLAQQAPACRFIALGGATEAAIWSNHFEVREALPGWRSIPYGLPLGNQAYRVVDVLGRDCPDWVTGSCGSAAQGLHAGIATRRSSVPNALSMAGTAPATWGVITPMACWNSWAAQTARSRSADTASSWGRSKPPWSAIPPSAWPWRWSRGRTG